MSPPLTILHVSDLQCGRPYSPVAGEALVRFAGGLDPDLVVVSGDLTQRAKAREFQAATGLMSRLPQVPTIVTLGNHDVPLYRAWERALVPYHNWRAYVSRELDTVTRVQGATLVALNSSAPRRAIVGGRIRTGQVEFARRAFAASAPDEVRALVIHHHFVPTPDRTGGRTLPRAAHLLRAFESMGVDLVLGGHVHQTHIRTSRELVDGGSEGIPLIACGTTTSRRGRGPETGANSLNVVCVGQREIEIRPHLLARGTDDFAPAGPIVLPRSRATEVASGGRKP